MNKKTIQDYAKLIVEFAVNVSTGQTVVIYSPVECAEFARQIATLAYQRQAKEVEIKYSDDKFSKIRLDNTAEEVLTDIPDYKIASREYYAQKNATMISIASIDPDLYQGSDLKKMGEVQKATSKAFKNYMDIVMKGKCPWVVVAYPSINWARKVFPDLEEAKALKELWKLVIKAIRLDQKDPVGAWNTHKEKIEIRKDFLNKKQFKQIKFTNSLGTNLTIGMPENHIWVGVSSKTPDGFEFIPNLPTEEIFSTPHKYQVDGTLVSSMPLNHSGQLVEDFKFEFKNGKVVNYSAKTGKGVLDNIFNIDEGASFLGEVALVPHSSPISEMGVMFYSTLYDENASCHFALGRAYPDCVENGKSLSDTQMEARGVNNSMTHVDFMIGSKDLSIIGVEKDGSEVHIFKHGDWAF